MSLFSRMLLQAKQFPLVETQNFQNFLKVALLSSGVTPATVLPFQSVTAKAGHLLSSKSCQAQARDVTQAIELSAMLKMTFSN